MAADDNRPDHMTDGRSGDAIDADGTPTHSTPTEVDGLRRRVGAARIVAVLEPRSNTMKRGVPRDGDDVLLVSRRGQGMRFASDEVRPMGRSAAGVVGMRFRASRRGMCR